MDIFFFQLIIIFIPGIIWERMDATYGPSKATEQWVFCDEHSCLVLLPTWPPFASIGSPAFTLTD